MTSFLNSIEDHHTGFGDAFERNVAGCYSNLIIKRENSVLARVVRKVNNVIYPINDYKGIVRFVLLTLIHWILISGG